MIFAVGKKVVTTAGTPVQLATQQQGQTYQRIRIQAEHDNTGRIYVGTAGMVVATGVNVLGVIAIPAATGVDIPYFDFGNYQGLGVKLADIWIDATVNGDGVFVAVA